MPKINPKGHVSAELKCGISAAWISRMASLPPLVCQRLEDATRFRHLPLTWMQNAIRNCVIFNRDGWDFSTRSLAER